MTNRSETAGASPAASAHWRATAAYLYVLRLEGPSLAWEYLRRNDAYQRVWDTRTSHNTTTAMRWGLRALEDPQLDARLVKPLWLTAAPSATGVTDSASDGHEIDALDARAKVGERRLSEDLPRIVVPRSPRIPAAVCASPRAMAHLRSLQAFDGVRAGASQREVAIALFGRERVQTQWLADSALRAQVRRDLQRARAYASGEYRALLRYVVVTKSSLTSPSQPHQTRCQHLGSSIAARGATEPDRMPSEPISRAAPRYLTADEAAEFLRLSPRTLEKHRGTGGGPRYRKFGRSVRYAMSDLEAWAEARAFEMTSDPDYPALRTT